MKRNPEAGFTLIETLIAITLLSAVVTGMLIALNNGLLTLDRVDERLLANRRAVGMDALLHNQIAGAMPVAGFCSKVRGPIFRGQSSAMLMVSSYSMNEGARGYPRILYYQALPDDGGTFRLVVHEFPYSGPASTDALCQGRSDLLPLGEGAQTFTIARGLAYCRFQYQRMNPLTGLGDVWVDLWDRLDLPNAVRIDMAPARVSPDAMPMLALTVPLRVTRYYQETYADQ